jgi:hypothetical protein
VTYKGYQGVVEYGEGAKVMPPALHRRIGLEARRTGKSLNRYIIDRLKPKALKRRR